jgi:hypothetical protein
MQKKGPYIPGAEDKSPKKITQSDITNVQMDAVRNVVRSHLEKHKFFDSLKTAVAKDPKMSKIDRNAVMERLKSEGVLSEIIQNLPVN